MLTCFIKRMHIQISESTGDDFSVIVSLLRYGKLMLASISQSYYKAFRVVSHTKSFTNVFVNTTKEALTPS